MIEGDSFAFEFISLIAEQESWRKDIYRPIYHVHKWWAKRLGSIFRGMLLGAVLPPEADLEREFYKFHNCDGTVLDPFMGSGTTIGEAHKLGFNTLGRDINPVACNAVRAALGPLDPSELKSAFGLLSSTVAEEIRKLYTSEDAYGNSCDVLYYFWVKTLPCPECTKLVDLFSSYIFVRNAYAAKKPEVKVLCPQCGDVFSAKVTDESSSCPACYHKFDLHSGPAKGTKVTCKDCNCTFSVAHAMRLNTGPPEHRLYAKLVLLDGEQKIYLPTTPLDEAGYKACSARLERENLPLPDLALEPGYNTNQAIKYGYTNWRHFFNDRQLLGLGLLHKEILRMENEDVRDAMLTVFSGALEFNNMFASYKGEGTGAVRHMFSHHILKPERTPLEANIWGTTKSSGSFSTLFKSRLFRAIDYRNAPSEISHPKKRAGAKTIVASLPFKGDVSTQWPPTKAKKRSIHISCGTSSNTHLQPESVDLVVTDPPFFDNVHYSELADFFYAWQRQGASPFHGVSSSTRSLEEVQDGEPVAFAKKLREIFLECYRVLKPFGMLIFSYHHSKEEGWTSVAEAIASSGFTLVNTHPVKAELSVATPKAQAKEPIQLDIIMVCRRKVDDLREHVEASRALEISKRRALTKLGRLREAGFVLSASDQRITYIAQFISELFPGRTASQLSKDFNLAFDEVANQNIRTPHEKGT